MLASNSQEADRIIANRSIQQKFLTNSRIILNAPGTLLTDLYYTKKNSTVEQIECEWTSGRYKQSLSSKSFESSGNVNIPNQSFAGLTLLELVLPDIAVDTCLPRGWGYAAIDRLDYIWGSSNQGNVNLSGQSLFQTVMAQCTTAEKRSRLLKLGGQEKLTSDGNQSKAYIVIPLPWSSVQGTNDGHKKPYDTSVLMNPIQLNVHFKAANAVYGGSGVKPTEFTRATVLLRQGLLSNPGLGLKPLVKAFNSNYVYPFLHRQPARFSKLAVGNVLEFNFDQMINADLLSIYFGIVRSSILHENDDNTPQIFNYEQVEDVEITHNGLILMSCPGESHLVFQSGQTNGDPIWQNSIVSPGTTTPFLSSPIDNSAVILDLTMTRQENFEGHMKNAKRYPQQTMNFKCTVPFNEEYTIYVTYIYNGMCSTGPDGTCQQYYN